MSTTPLTLEDLATSQRDQSSLPAGFDPAAHPIIAKHVFGVEPFPIDQIAQAFSVAGSPACIKAVIEHGVEA